MTDIINHPSHYMDSAILVEPIELTSLLPHPLASAYEYAIRAGKKEGSPELVDLKKAQFWVRYYLNNDLFMLGFFPQRAVFMLKLFAKYSPVHPAGAMYAAAEEASRGFYPSDAERNAAELRAIAEAMEKHVDARISKLEGADHEKA